MKTALVLTHLGFDDLGIWAKTLAGSGYDIACCDVPRADAARSGPRLAERSDRVLREWLEGLD